MNAHKEIPPAGPSRNPFWACAAVFLVLAVDAGLRFYSLLQGHAQLRAAARTQEQNRPHVSLALAQAAQIEARLRPFTLELLELAKTNAAARQIVQEFKIQWTPPEAARASPVAPTETQKK
jgi:hypothetical protein